MQRSCYDHEDCQQVFECGLGLAHAFYPTFFSTVSHSLNIFSSGSKQVEEIGTLNK